MVQNQNSPSWHDFPLNRCMIFTSGSPLCDAVTGGVVVPRWEGGKKGGLRWPRGQRGPGDSCHRLKGILFMPFKDSPPTTKAGSFSGWKNGQCDGGYAFTQWSQAESPCHYPTTWRVL